MPAYSALTSRAWRQCSLCGTELDAMLRSDPGVEQTDDTVYDVAAVHTLPCQPHHAPCLPRFHYLYSGEYPAYFKLGDILDTWNPDLPHPPPQAAKHDSLVRLDYSNEVLHRCCVQRAAPAVGKRWLALRSFTPLLLHGRRNASKPSAYEMRKCLSLCTTSQAWYVVSCPARSGLPALSLPSWLTMLAV